MSDFACPRCHTALPAGAFYGPCAACRVALRETADHRYRGWLAVMFLAGRLAEPKPMPAPGRPGAPAGPSARALDPSRPSRAIQTPIEERALDRFVVLVTGSRTWTAPEPIGIDLGRLQAEHGDALTVVHGGARGAGCEVRADCLAHALDEPERFGIWGGTSTPERRRIRRARRQAVA